MLSLLPTENVLELEELIARVVNDGQWTPEAKAVLDEVVRRTNNAGRDA